MSNASRAILLSIVTLLFIGCEDDPVDPLASARVEVVSGSRQDGIAGAQLSQPVSIRVLSAQGTPLARVVVHWIVLEGGGTVATDSSITDQAGVASTDWTLGGAPGVQALLARTRTASIRIEATASITFASVAAGFRHTCALTGGGAAFCWGLNDRGQLGMGTTSPVEAPVLVHGNLQFRSLSSGWFHTCGVTRAGEAYCWGDNSVGQLGSAGPTAALPRRVTGLADVATISAGYQHTCATTTGGALHCWGVDDVGQLGTGRTTAVCFNPVVQRCSATPLRVTGTLNFREVTAGEFHTCALALDATLYCWGWNSNGQIGNLGAGNAVFDVPTRAISNRAYSSINAGARHNCAVTSVSRLECWGRNFAGEIGVTAGVALSAPQPLTTSDTFRQTEAGEHHSCALATDGRVLCWGALLGNGTTATSEVPVPVTLNGSASWVSAAGEHACAVVAGAVWCWGANGSRQLGVAGVVRSNAPVRVEIGS